MSGATVLLHVTEKAFAREMGSEKGSLERTGSDKLIQAAWHSNNPCYFLAPGTFLGITINLITLQNRIVPTLYMGKPTLDVQRHKGT